MPSYEGLTYWVIYEHPSDYPLHFVVRKSTVTGSSISHSPLAELYDSLDAARQRIPPGLINIGRMKDDEPQIKEVWV